MTASEATRASTATAGPGDRHGRRVVRRLLIPPAVALTSVVVLFFVYVIARPELEATWTGASSKVPALLAILAPTVLVVLVIAGLVVLTSRYFRRGLPVVAVMSVLFSAVIVYGMVVMMFDDSSTGGLLFFFLPIELGLVAIPFVVGIPVVNWMRGRKQRTATTP